MQDYVTIISIAVTPISSIITWVVARRARNNDMLQKMQSTIDMLVEKNQELYNEVILLRAKVAELTIGKP